MTENASGSLIPRAAGTEILDVRTGEAVDVRGASDDFLAGYLAWIREEIDAPARAAKRALSVEIHRRLDQEGRWTREVGRIRIKGQGPLTPDYDPDRTREALEILLEEGRISAETLERVCPQETVNKPKKGELAKLRRANPDADALLAEGEKPVDQDSRRVTLEEIPERFAEEVVEGEVVEDA